MTKMPFQPYYLMVAEELAQAATNLHKALATGDRDPIEKAARRVFGLTQALDETPDCLVSIHKRAKDLAERATKKFLPVSKVFADAPMEDLGQGINLRPGIPYDTCCAVLTRAHSRCEDCGCRPMPGEMHHLHYRTKGRERPEDLMYLCRDCHQDRHMTASGFVSDPEVAERLRARAAGT